MSFKGKTVIVTGASRGIGEATARHFAALGAHVVLAARDEARIRAIAAELEAEGHAACAWPTDVADEAQVAALVAATLEETGRLDLLVNNAGLIDPIARLGESTPEAWGRVVDVNLKGVYHGLRHAIPAMVAQGGGTVVNISSGAATSALEGWSHYCATKAAVLSLTRVADKEYRSQGVRVLGLSPGTVATAMQAQIRASGINPVSQLDWSAHIPPEWVARAIEWLTTESANAHLGTDFSIKTDEGRRLVGLAAT
ncbi:SDR family oxidoreductase [Vannielia litorea]|uniref:SDR family oxidoreductase n=1 Tax=Vannielia litorea TaxID=1217970 RepID=UPI001BCB2050|nr:SDR family oxidoreductase [Vannielia litorea]MBS8227485.1 SDR family NAD(P)-dependent oxidoreductase [Vannielia litorea]